MKREIICRWAAAAALAFAGTSWRAVAVEPAEAAGLLSRTSSDEELNKISLSYRMGLNIKVDFNKLGGFARIGDPGPATGANFDRTYEQGGYNRVDIWDNFEGRTWFYGYDNPEALQGDYVVLQSSASPANRSVEGKEESVQHGVELAYTRQLARGKYGKLGAEVSFSYVPLSISDSTPLKGTVDRILDRYDTGGVNPPLAPFHGSFDQPNARISSSPNRDRVLLRQEADILGERTLEADVFVFRLGPSHEFLIKGRLSGNLGAGLTLAIADADFSYRETVSIPGVGTQTRSASSSSQDFLVGWYAGAALSFRVANHTDVFAGAYFQSAGDAVTKSGRGDLGSKEGVLDLDEAVVVNFGISYSF